MGIARTGCGRWLAAVALFLGSLLVLVLAPVRLDADASERSSAATTNVVARPQLRDDFLVMTNADRGTRDRDGLALAERLSRYAERHSRRMAALGYLFHSGDEQLRDALQGERWSVAGENVGVGVSLAAVQRSFMASAPHRRNILEGAFDHAAIGIVESGGAVWVTVVFYGA